MSVNESITAYSTTAASNTPAGTSNIGTDLDDHLRDVKKNIRVLSDEFSAAASQVFLSADRAATLFVTVGSTVTGTYPISAAGSFASGVNVSLTPAPLISATYSGTFVPVKIDAWGRSLEFTAFSSLAASNKDTFSGSSTQLYVTPASLAAAQECVRVFVSFDGSGTASAFLSWNLDSVRRTANGTYVVDWSSAPLTGTHFVANVTAEPNANGASLILGDTTRTTTSYKFSLKTVAGSKIDSQLVCVSIFGRLASMIV